MAFMINVYLFFFLNSDHSKQILPPFSRKWFIKSSHFYVVAQNYTKCLSRIRILVGFFAILRYFHNRGDSFMTEICKKIVL